MDHIDRRPDVPGDVFIVRRCANASAGFVAWFGRPIAALLIVGLGTLAAAIFAPPERRLWVTIGIGYAGTLLLAPMFLRADGTYGFAVIVLLFAIVWTTDIVGYFVGRAFGGPKLLPAVSPKKTWSGAIAGTVGAMIAALLIASLFGSFNKIAIARCRIDLVGAGAVWRSVRIVGEAAIRRQRFQSTHSRARRRDGQARWFLGGCSSWLPDRIGRAAASMSLRADCCYGEFMTAVDVRPFTLKGTVPSVRVDTILGRYRLDRCQHA